jgi:hypothetical protein
MEGDAGGAGALDQQLHQIGIECCERPRPPVEDRDNGISARGHVRELEGYVAAADHQDPVRQALEIEEAIAAHDVGGAGHGKRRRLRPARDRHVARAQTIVADHEGGLVEEARAALERGDPGFGERSLPVRRHRVGEAALESHESRPIDRQAGVAHALAAHQPGRLDHLGPAAQHLLRVAAAQGAGAAEGQLVDDRDRPSSRAAGVGHRAPGHAGADHDQVEAPVHQPASARSRETIGTVCGQSRHQRLNHRWRAHTRQELRFRACRECVCLGGDRRTAKRQASGLAQASRASPALGQARRR